MAPAFHVSLLASCHHLFTGPSPVALHQCLAILLLQPIILHRAIKAASVKGTIRSRCSPFPRLVVAWSCIQNTRGSPLFPLPTLPASALKRWPLIPFDIHDFVPSALSTWVTVVVLCWGEISGIVQGQIKRHNLWGGAL